MAIDVVLHRLNSYDQTKVVYFLRNYPSTYDQAAKQPISTFLSRKFLSRKYQENFPSRKFPFRKDLYKNLVVIVYSKFLHTRVQEL